METNKLVVGIVAAAIAIIVLAGVLMPALAIATDTNDTFTNEGYFYMTKYDLSSELTIDWDHSDPNKLTINDETITIPNIPSDLWVSLLIGDDYYLRYAISGTTVQFQFGGLSALAVSSTGSNDLKIESANGTMTGTVYSGDTVISTKELTYTELYCLSETGDYVMKKSDAVAYINDDTPIVGLGQTRWDNLHKVICRISGTIEDLDIDVVESTPVGVAVVDNTTVINKTDLSGYNGYTLSSIKFDVLGEGVDSTITYSYFVVPAEVTLEKSVHLTDAMNVILNVIPLLIIVAVLLGVVAVFVLRRE